MNLEQLSLYELHQLTHQIEEYKLKKQTTFNSILQDKNINELNTFISHYPQDAQYLTCNVGLSTDYTMNDILFIQTALSYLKDNQSLKQFETVFLFNSYKVEQRYAHGLFHKAFHRDDFFLLEKHFKEPFLVFFKKQFYSMKNNDDDVVGNLSLESLLFLKPFYNDSDFRYFLNDSLKSRYDMKVYHYFKQDEKYSLLFNDYIRGLFIRTMFEDPKERNIDKYCHDPFYAHLFQEKSSFIKSLYNDSFSYQYIVSNDTSLFQFCLDNFTSSIPLQFKHDDDVSHIIKMEVSYFNLFLTYIKKPETCVFAFGHYFSKHYHLPDVQEKFMLYFDFIQHQPECMEQFKKFIKIYQSKSVDFNQLTKKLLLNYQLEHDVTNPVVRPRNKI